MNGAQWNGSFHSGRSVSFLSDSLASRRASAFGFPSFMKPQNRSIRIDVDWSFTFHRLTTSDRTASSNTGEEGMGQVYGERRCLGETMEPPASHRSSGVCHRARSGIDKLSASAGPQLPASYGHTAGG